MILANFNELLHEYKVMSSKPQIMVTSALPYPNGPLHLGHMVEYVQTDIWARLQRLQGQQCLYVCGTDAHGTPVMLLARKQGIQPEALIDNMRKQFLADFTDFQIGFDNFYTTHSAENRQLAAMIYEKLRQNGDIVTRTIEQAYDAEANMFLPDRFVKGTCPNCAAEDQYGDSCDQCGATYAATALKNPRSVISGSTPTLKQSEHFFFDLPKYQTFLQDWLQACHVPTSIVNKLDEWFAAGLQQWDISRDAPYFGFEIPNAPGKYFYVWLDAPLGYLASLKNLASQRPDIDFDAFMRPDSKTELHHFIGKDIVYFHALFWPAMLKGSGLRTPSKIHVHGFLTINGKKMSKSRGTFIQARTYLNHLPADYLRYYYATKLTSHIDDIDLNLDDFMQRVNTDLVGKFINIASRCGKFIQQYFHNQLATQLDNAALYSQFVAKNVLIAKLYDTLEYNHAMREIMQLANIANQYIDAEKPWQLIKDPQHKVRVGQICTTGLNLFRILMLYLKPVLPRLAKRVEAFFNIPAMQWQDCHMPLLDHTINPFQALLKRITKEQIMAVLAEAAEDGNSATTATNSTSSPTTATVDKPAIEPIKDTISIDDFSKVDLRIAKIIDAQHVEGADKLLQLTVDIGNAQRQIFAGIKAAYDPGTLIGKHTVVVVNLAPRKMRFGVSDGMVLAAGPGGKSIWILEPHDGATAGMRVK